MSFQPIAFLQQGLANFKPTIFVDGCTIPRWNTPSYVKADGQLWFSDEATLKSNGLKPPRYTFKPRCIHRIDALVDSEAVQTITSYLVQAKRHSDTDYASAPQISSTGYFQPNLTTIRDMITFLGLTEPSQPYTIVLYFRMYRPLGHFRKRKGQPGPCIRKKQWLGNKYDSLPLLLSGRFI